MDMKQEALRGANRLFMVCLTASILFLYGVFFLSGEEQQREENAISGTDFQQTISSLEKQISECADTETKRDLLVQAARLCELAGDIEQAQKYYEQSVFIEINEASFPFLYASAIVLFEMGEWEKSLFQCELIINGSADMELGNRALNLTIRCLIELERNQEAKDKFESLQASAASTSKSLYSLYITALHLGLSDHAERLKQSLIEKYPSSMETQMLTGKITEYPSPYRFFYELPGSGDSASPEEASATTGNPDVTTAAKSVFIQIGSFRDRENAEYRRMDAQKAGLKAEIREVVVNGTTYYRLIVPSSSQTLQEDLTTVKGKGFEGYPLYE